MNKNEISKLLYKHNPIAYLDHISKEGLLYYTQITVDQEYEFYFLVPIDDLGDARFENQMEGKFLRRWLIATENN